MTTLEPLTTPAARFLRAAARPASYAGHAREVTSVLVTAGMWPFGWAGSALPTTGDRGGAVASPVVLLHGYGANKSNWLFVNHQLRQAGFDQLHAFNYNPLTSDIHELAMRCVAECEALRDHVGAPRIHLVGHSLGGLIARYAVQVLGLRNVGVCASVASPHQGSSAAYLSALVRGRGPARSVHDLRPGSAVMRELRTAVPPRSTRFVAYYSNLDLVVPAARARIVDAVVPAENILVKDHGHLSIMLSRRLGSSLAEHLGAAEVERPHGLVERARTAPPVDAGSAGPLRVRVQHPDR